MNHTRKIRYLSSDPHIAKVDKKGRVTAVGKGKCLIYAMSINGCYKSIKVTVN